MRARECNQIVIAKASKDALYPVIGLQFSGQLLQHTNTFCSSKFHFPHLIPSYIWRRYV